MWLNLEDNIIEEVIEYSDELYQKAIEENNFSGSEQDRIGDDANADN